MQKVGYISAPDGSLLDYTFSVGCSYADGSGADAATGITYSASSAFHAEYGIYVYDFTVNFDCPWKNSSTPDKSAQKVKHVDIEPFEYRFEKTKEKNEAAKQDKRTITVRFDGVRLPKLYLPLNLFSTL